MTPESGSESRAQLVFASVNFRKPSVDYSFVIRLSILDKLSYLNEIIED